MKAIVLFAALLSAPHQGVNVPRQSPDEKAIKAVHARLLAAFTAGKADVIKTLFTTGFTETANGMTFNRDQAAAQMAQGSSSAKVVWTISGIKVTGDKASYTSNFRFETTSVDNSASPGHPGTTHTISGTGAQKLQLVKHGGKWLYSRMQVISSKVTMDGKPFVPQYLQGSPSKQAH